MASSQRNTNRFNFGEEGFTLNNINNEGNSGQNDIDNDNDQLLNTNLSYSTSREYEPHPPSSSSFNNLRQKSNSLSFSHSQSYSYPHSPSDNDNKNAISSINRSYSHCHSYSYPTPQDSTDSVISPLEQFKLKQWLNKYSLGQIYHKLIKAGLYDMYENTLYFFNVDRVFITIYIPVFLRNVFYFLCKYGTKNKQRIICGS